jgi:GcrA cell cycle regulator
MKPPYVKPTFLADQVRVLLYLPNEEIAAKLNCSVKYVQQCRREKPIRPARSGNWNDERIETMKQLWAAGLSASQVAARLGTGITRNAVISKVHRLGLQARATQVRIRTKPRKVKLAPPPKPISPAAELLKAIKRDGLPLPPPAETDIARVSLDKLDRHHCRWICSDEGHPIYDLRYCGAKRVVGASYCAPHLVRSTSAPQPRKRQELRVVAGNELQVA